MRFGVVFHNVRRFINLTLLLLLIVGTLVRRTNGAFSKIRKFVWESIVGTLVRRTNGASD